MGESVNREKVFRKEDGTVSWIWTPEHRIQYIFGVDGEQIGWQKTGMDVTEFSDGTKILELNGGEYGDWLSDADGDPCALIHELCGNLYACHMVLRDKKVFEKMKRIAYAGESRVFRLSDEIVEDIDKLLTLGNKLSQDIEALVAVQE